MELKLTYLDNYTKILGTYGNIVNQYTELNDDILAYKLVKRKECPKGKYMRNLNLSNHNVVELFQY